MGFWTGTYVLEECQPSIELSREETGLPKFKSNFTTTHENTSAVSNQEYKSFQSDVTQKIMEANQQIL